MLLENSQELLSLAERRADVEVLDGDLVHEGCRVEVLDFFATQDGSGMNQVRYPVADLLREPFFLAFCVAVLVELTTVLPEDLWVEKLEGLYLGIVRIEVACGRCDDEVALVVKDDFHAEAVGELLRYVVIDEHLEIRPLVLDTDP